MILWTVMNETLYTSNGGPDCFENPLIPFDEFLEDISLVGKNEFTKLVKELYTDEISKLPYHMKVMAVEVMVDWRKNFDVKQKNYMKKIKHM